ncbi:MAG: hypothetical protein V4646_11300 [Pseudomonadota bacterium]
MDARIIFPNGHYTGNLLWNKAEALERETAIANSLALIRLKDYWASAYPEGDGVTFTDKRKRSDEEVLKDFMDCFNWLEIAVGQTKNSNFELADLETDAEMQCTVIVPLSKLKIEATFSIGDFRFVCNKEFDSEPHERLGDFECEYVEFKTQLLYKDLLRVNSSLDHNDYVINKCLATAESAMDLVRYQFSSFIKPHFTPNPAGQLADGFYSIELIPEERTHIKPISLSGISKPISVSNNWLGPEVEEPVNPGIGYLVEILKGRSDELALSVKSALRASRQSFYALGDESKFLNLVFALDGLVTPGDWTGWKHRTYIAALLSGGSKSTFKSTLKRYDELYEIRNRLVHGGADFYEIECGPAQACQDIYWYICGLVTLIESNDFETTSDLHLHAKGFLTQESFIQIYTEVINDVSARRSRKPKIPSWVL